MQWLLLKGKTPGRLILENKDIRLIDLSFNFEPEFDTPEQVILKHRKGYGYIGFAQEHLHVTIIEHIAYEGQRSINGTRYAFFRSNKRFWHIPFKTFRHIREERPDVILSQGLIFPLQIIALRLYLGKRCPIIVQHHGGRPFTGIKKRVQRMADRCIHAYIFTSHGNAEEWVRQKIIRDAEKCHEIPALSTWHQREDKQASRQKLGMTGCHNFLWVGRLDANKDPVTVLQGFEKYVAVNPLARLYMIYQTEYLKADVQTLISKSPLLKKAVCLQGKIGNEELLHWYNAADFYLSGSHKESFGLALVEAMACGCIPVVTDIPSFRKITANGRLGFLYEPGNATRLFHILDGLAHINRPEMQAALINHFRKELSFSAIANKIYLLCDHLINHKPL